MNEVMEYFITLKNEIEDFPCEGIERNFPSWPGEKFIKLVAPLTKNKSSPLRDMITLLHARRTRDAVVATNCDLWELSDAIERLGDGQERRPLIQR